MTVLPHKACTDQSLHLHYHWSSFVQACQIVNLHHNSGLLPAHSNAAKRPKVPAVHLQYFWWFTLTIEPFKPYTQSYNDACCSLRVQQMIDPVAQHKYQGLELEVSDTTEFVV